MFRKRKKNLSRYAYVLQEKARQDISRRSRPVMAKKCIKKCDAHAEWFSLSNLLLFFFTSGTSTFLLLGSLNCLLISNTVISW